MASDSAERSAEKDEGHHKSKDPKDILILSMNADARARDHFMTGDFERAN